MASKLSKCSENQIAAILDTQSNSDSEQELYLVDKLKKKKCLKFQTATKDDSDVSSDTENVFHNGKYSLPKRNVSQKEKASLKVKLRRSTEQSLYKIYADADHEKPIFKSHNPVLRQKKEICSEVKSKESSINNIDSVVKTIADSAQKLTENQIQNEVLRSSRIRRAPIKYSSYHCDSLVKSPPANSPSLRNRKSINYNEDKLLINHIVSNMEAEKKLTRHHGNKRSDNSIHKHKSELTPVNSNIKSNKRNRIPSVKDGNDSGTDSAIVKIKALKKSIKSESSINDKLSHAPEIKEITKKGDLLILTSTGSTPTKSNKQKRVICEDREKNIQHTNDNDNDDKEEYLADMYKRIKISSAVKNVTPTKVDRQKCISGDIQTSVQFDNNNNSGTEEECLVEMYKHIKISSAKKNILMPQKKNNTRQKGRESYLEETHLSTPKSCSVKCSNLTPSLGKRYSTLLKPITPLQEARSRLHVSAVPKSLPCREEEFNNIFTFLRGKLEDKSGGCIYISGVPGTGKTATVNEAVRCLQKLTLKGRLDDFDYVAINGMKLTEPRQAYVQILKQLDNKTATWEQAYRILEKRFDRATSKMTLLLVDELDFLCTKRQDVVYNLLDWPTKSTAQLVVITIANTMDLPERVLMGRVTSRLGLTRLTFQPYNYKQLQEIVMSRLKDFDDFRSEAVQLVSRKVSAVSGDARRALDICRRAMEIAESRNAKTISLQHVTQAVSEMIASAKVQAIKHCSKMEKMFLQAVSAEVVRTSIEEVYFKDAYKQLESLCFFDGIEIPSVTEVLAVCGRLGANRLLICEHSRNDIYQKILLNVSTDDIHYAIQELDLNSK
ncbi:Origin recognition complex subunit 1 [Habropoda laboriosa]|uniref:Origin recognition complex subunit 1 n=1 Tax=Habropoda laboriosa TaxID=597456 RepID=A0A0L7QKZ6_9HYME|nr:PREDICTED: origin recognition complex subunit 1 [Habropoda laboriosa]KOC59201.1 Origin recognition complex subunit 1 [Habropoda laboriosa]